MTIRSVSVGLIALVLSASSAQAQRATIQGVIRFSGPDPAPATVAVSHDLGYCGPALESQHLLVSKGRVKDVVVYLEGVKPMQNVRARPIELNHDHCNLATPVQTADQGAELVLYNGDAITHTVAVQRAGNELARVVLGPQRTRSTRNLSKPGLVVVGCTVHTWIYSYVWVFDHPFYSVTRDDGSFQLPFVYPGTYKLTAWHAELGTQTQEVVVGADQVLKVNFSFPAPRITQ